MHYRKIGGLHWLFIGRLRIAFCIKAKHRRRKLPKAKQLAELMA
jgi:hypothetical protein